MGAILETQRELREVLNDGIMPKDLKAEILPAGADKKHYPIAFNALPQIDVFTDNDYTYEEMKMTNETKKNHGRSNNCSFCNLCTYSSSFSALRVCLYRDKRSSAYRRSQGSYRRLPGAVLEDDVSRQIYPQAVNAVGKRETFVGRIRKDLDTEKVSICGVVSDNPLKGAAWNSVQIAGNPA